MITPVVIEKFHVKGIVRRMSTNHSLPKTMKAAVLHAYEGASALKVEERPLPTPRAGEVLVKIVAAPINPSDVMFIQGLYGFKKDLPVVPGFESSGIVVGAGSGILPRYWLNRRVAALSQNKGDGVWAEYVCVPVMQALPLSKEVNMEQGAMAAVNPLTAWALLEKAKKGRHKVVINTAAASALGRMMIRLAPRFGVEIINVVRRAEQVALLQGMGARYVLNSSDAGFDAGLNALCREHNVRLAFDAVAGDMPLRLLSAMRRGAQVTVYGALSLDACHINPADLIFRGASVNGFWLSEFVTLRNTVKLLRINRQVQSLLATDLRSDVHARYGLTQIHEALADYQANMTAGKVLIMPQLD